MSVREREHGELPSPIWSLSSRKAGQGLYVVQDGPAELLVRLGLDLLSAPKLVQNVVEKIRG